VGLGCNLRSLAGGGAAVAWLPYVKRISLKTSNVAVPRVPRLTTGPIPRASGEVDQNYESGEGD
jgi:hypothetical protein